jgi:hypothetical protein
MKSKGRAPERPKASEILDGALDSLRKRTPPQTPVRERRRRLPGEPDLTPHFPIAAFSRVQIEHDGQGGWRETPVRCPHKRRYRKGTPFVCMVCHKSGMDHLGALQRHARSDPKPEQAPEAKPAKPLTRKELRALRRDYKLREATLTSQERDYLKGLGVAL